MSLLPSILFFAPVIPPSAVQEGMQISVPTPKGGSVAWPRRVVILGYGVGDKAPFGPAVSRLHCQLCLMSMCESLTFDIVTSVT